MAHSSTTSSTADSPSPTIFKRKRTARVRSAPANNDEEVDMANCLILLAKGRTFPLYECKTCNKSFSSFQALGGHRASHKKPKMPTLEVENSIVKGNDCSSSGGGKQRTHECSICRFEFSSGQALGGHMRKHRSVLILENSLEINKKENRAFLFDLNLPAPIVDCLY